MEYLQSSKITLYLNAYPDAFEPVLERLIGTRRQCDSHYEQIYRFFNPKAVSPGQIAVRRRDSRFALTDPLVKEYASYIATTLRRKGRLYDGPTVTMVTAFNPDSDSPTMVLQEASYEDFAGSCFALDFAHTMMESYGGTLRHYILRRYGERMPQERPLAACLGVCAYVLVQEGTARYLLQVTRSGSLASLADTRGPSAAGSVDYADNDATLADLIGRSMGAELFEELNLQPEDYTLVPLAFAREILRGNPQIFCLARTTLDRKTLTARLERLPEASREFSDFTFLPLSPDHALSENDVKTLNHEARMCYYLTEEYLAENIGT